MGVTDTINEKLARYCSDQYGNGSVGAANILWLENQGYDFIRIERVYRLGNLPRFIAPVQDSRKFHEFLTALEGLEDYPLFDEDVLSELQDQWTEEAWEQLRTENGLDSKTFYEVISEGEYYWYDEGMADSYGMSAEFDIDEFVLTVRKASQTWNAHYNSAMAHEPEVCQYCDEAKVEES